MATPKRKYSFGLMTRLAMIGTFVGLGSWAVLNSKFKQDEPEQIAQTESGEGADQEEENDSSKKSQDDTEGQSSSESLKDTNARPASFLQQEPSNENKSPVGSVPGKLSEKNRSTKPSSSGSSLPSSKPPSTKPPSSPGFASPSSKSGGFSPPSSTGFTPGNTGFTPGGSKKKDAKMPSSNSFGGSSSKKKKSGPPNSKFDPGAGANPATAKAPGSSKSSKTDSKKFDPNRPNSTPPSSAPPSSTPPSFSPRSTNSKSGLDPSKSTASTFGGGGFGAKSSSSSKSNETKPERPANSSFLGSSKAGKSGSAGPPSATFDPRGPLASKGGSSGIDSFNPSGGTGDRFQTKSSKGDEPSLRGGTSVRGNEKSRSSFASDSRSISSDSTGANAPDNKFSLSRGGQSPTENNPPKFGGASGNFGGAGAKAPNNSQPPNFNPRGNAFEDKGSKPLPKNTPGQNGLVKSKGAGGLGSSSTGFADIGKPPKSPDGAASSKGGTSLDPNKFGSSSSGSLNQGSLNSGSLNPGKDPRSGRNRLGKARDTGSANTQFANDNRSKGPGFAASPGMPGSVKTGVEDRKPGPNALQGVQTPAITLQKIAPREVQVDSEAEFQLIVRNVGRTTATNIYIVDPIPAGAQYVSAEPAPTERSTDGSLVWKFGALAPNQQKVINVRLLPKQQGEIGSIARMSFQAAATAKSICTKPEISITHEGPQKVLVGQNARFVVTIKNNGDGVAKNIMIEDEVPPGFAFGNGKGNRLAYEIGNLAPGDRREVQLNLRAVEPGRYVNEIRAKMGKTTASNHKLNVEVVKPKLNMDIVGPTRRYIQREAKYRVEVQNSGTASAKNVLAVTRLPKGLRFVRTNNRGQYNPREHAVYWSMVELPPQAKGTVELVLMPAGTGQQEIEFEARSLIDRTDLKKFPVIVDQLAELFFEVDDRDDPIEVNGETEYKIRVVNQGSKAATNVVVNVEMPTGIQATDTKGPTKGNASGPRIVFEPVASLAPRGELIYKIKARGVQDGEHQIKVLLSSSERQKAVAKQESTKVYSEFR